MAWGYWSATAVSATDRGRSPRRNQNGSTGSHTLQTVPTTVEERPAVSTHNTNVNSNNNAQISEFDVAASFSRRPSLDLGNVGPQGALATILCAAHGSRPQSGTLSAGNTLTRLGSRHAASSGVEYAVPHHFHHHHHAAYVEYHQSQLSFSDDDSSSEPGYATGTPYGKHY